MVIYDVVRKKERKERERVLSKKQRREEGKGNAQEPQPQKAGSRRREGCWACWVSVP